MRPTQEQQNQMSESELADYAEWMNEEFYEEMED